MVYLYFYKTGLSKGQVANIFFFQSIHFQYHGKFGEKIQQSATRYKGNWIMRMHDFSCLFAT